MCLRDRLVCDGAIKSRRIPTHHRVSCTIGIGMVGLYLHHYLRGVWVKLLTVLIDLLRELPKYSMGGMNTT